MFSLCLRGFSPGSPASPAVQKHACEANDEEPVACFQSEIGRRRAAFGCAADSLHPGSILTTRAICRNICGRDLRWHSKVLEGLASVRDAVGQIF